VVTKPEVKSRSEGVKPRDPIWIIEGVEGIDNEGESINGSEENKNMKHLIVIEVSEEEDLETIDLLCEDIEKLISTRIAYDDLRVEQK